VLESSELRHKSPFLGVDHQVFVVRDLEAKLRFWTKDMGFNLAFKKTDEDLGFEQAFFDLSDGTFIELLAPTNETSPLNKILREYGDCLYVLALKVSEITSAIDQLSKQGANVTVNSAGRVFVESNPPALPKIQLWPINQRHSWRPVSDSDQTL
jgi:methylmalonyl-CoA/ethylmalonyl-CoA epimerase